MGNCKARRYSDQMQCDQCGLQWDVNDPDPPECNPVVVDSNEIAHQRSINTIKELFENE